MPSPSRQFPSDRTPSLLPFQSCSQLALDTIPRHVRYTIDMRARHGDTLARFRKVALRTLGSIAGHENCRFTQKVDFMSAATNFHADCIRCVEEAAEAVTREEATAGKGKTLARRMISGAGHDTVFTSKRCPSSMVFVPCRDGVSHHPEEYSTPEDCANGASVLLGAVVRYDRSRKSATA